MVRAVQATNPDIVYIGAYPPDNVGIIRAANEIGLSPKMMGGAMIGMLVTPIKVQLGPIANGLITGENYAAATAPSIPGAPEFLKRYSAKAAAAGVDPLGFAWGPFAYGAGQVLAQAVTETKSLDHDKLAEYMHKASFKTVAGRFLLRQERRMVEGAHGLDASPERPAEQSRSVPRRQGAADRVAAEAKTGTLIYPYADARKK